MDDTNSKTMSTVVPSAMHSIESIVSQVCDTKIDMESIIQKIMDRKAASNNESMTKKFKVTDAGTNELSGQSVCSVNLSIIRVSHVMCIYLQVDDTNSKTTSIDTPSALHSIESIVSQAFDRMVKSDTKSDMESMINRIVDRKVKC